MVLDRTGDTDVDKLRGHCRLTPVSKTARTDPAHRPLGRRLPWQETGTTVRGCAGVRESWLDVDRADHLPDRVHGVPVTLLVDLGDS